MSKHIDSWHDIAEDINVLVMIIRRSNPRQTYKALDDVFGGQMKSCGAKRHEVGPSSAPKIHGLVGQLERIAGTTRIWLP